MKLNGSLYPLQRGQQKLISKLNSELLHQISYPLERQMLAQIRDRVTNIGFFNFFILHNRIVRSKSK